MDQHSPGGSVTIWLNQLKSDPAAAKPLWDRYFTRLVALARARLRAVPRGAADEEDVALSAFDSFCQAVAVGRFPQLDDRHDLWQVLFVLTTRKAIGLARHETRAKRGGSRSAHLRADDPSNDVLNTAVAAGPTPDEAAEVAEECSQLLGLLNSSDLRQVALWKMEGDTNEEIATKLNRSV